MSWRRKEEEEEAAAEGKKGLEGNRKVAEEVVEGHGGNFGFSFCWLCYSMRCPCLGRGKVKENEELKEWRDDFYF